MSRTYEIHITHGEHGHFGNAKLGLRNALHALIREIEINPNLPPNSEVGIRTEGRDYNATIFQIIKE